VEEWDKLTMPAWLALAVLGSIAAGAAFNFGRGNKHWKGVKPTAARIKKENKAL